MRISPILASIIRSAFPASWPSLSRACFSSIESLGYLHEAYHGGPYVTRQFIPEAFEAPDLHATIAAAVLRARLPAALALAIERMEKVYHEKATADDPAVKAFSDFVALAERQEKATGKPVTVEASY